MQALNRDAGDAFSRLQCLVLPKGVIRELPEGAQVLSPPDGPIDLPFRRSVYISMTVEADAMVPEKLKHSDRGRFVATIVPGEGREATASLDRH